MKKKNSLSLGLFRKGQNIEENFHTSGFREFTYNRVSRPAEHESEISFAITWLLRLELHFLPDPCRSNGHIYRNLSAFYRLSYIVVLIGGKFRSETSWVRVVLGISCLECELTWRPVDSSIDWVEAETS